MKDGATAPIRQRLHLIPEEREKLCQHRHMPYSGRMPCTGPRRCSMCGFTEDEIQEIEPMKIRAKRITIKWSENEEPLPRSFSMFEDAEALIRRMRQTAPDDGSYDKTDFEIEFEDGETYQGRIDLERNVAETIAQHCIEFATFYSGRQDSKTLPAHLPPDQYRMVMRRYTDEQRAQWAKFLDNYEFSDRAGVTA